VQEWLALFLDNARYHHAKLVQEWLAQPGRRIKLHFIPTYCPHLNPIERLWGVTRAVSRVTSATSISICLQGCSTLSTESRGGAFRVM
jgi:transposase